MLSNNFFSPSSNNHGLVNSLGNLNISSHKELQQNDVFSGYKCPHPLENKIIFKIISDNPKKAVIQAISRLIFKLEQLNNF